MISCYSQEQLDKVLTTYLSPSSEILEVFIERQRPTAQERADLLTEANRADKDRRAGG